MHVTIAGPAGRIVAASPREFLVESFTRDAAPPLGALVVTAEDAPAVYGIVSGIVTEGVDPSRPLAPHGAADEDLETVLSRHPHLPVLLRTTFTVAIVAHEQDGALCYYLPASPPRLISRVRLCDSTEQERFANRLDFLAPLLDCGLLADDVVAACLRRLGSVRDDEHRYLVEAGRALVPLLVNEPERLTAIIRRIRPAAE